MIVSVTNFNHFRAILAINSWAMQIDKCCTSNISFLGCNYLNGAEVSKSKFLNILGKTLYFLWEGFGGKKCLWLSIKSSAYVISLISAWLISILKYFALIMFS